MAINKFVKAVLTGEEITIYGDGEQTRDFTYASDVVEANLLAAESDAAGEVLNIGGGARISVNQLISKIEMITGKKARLEYTGEQRGDMRDTLADVKKVGELLNWQPKIKIEDGLRSYINWLDI